MFTPYVVERLKEVSSTAGYGNSAYALGKYMDAHHPNHRWPNHQITAMSRGTLVPQADKQCLMLKEAGLEPELAVFSFAVDAVCNDKRSTESTRSTFVAAEAELYERCGVALGFSRAERPA